MRQDNRIGRLQEPHLDLPDDLIACLDGGFHGGCCWAHPWQSLSRSCNEQN